MEFADDDLLTLPYAARRLIVVENDEAVEVFRRAASKAGGSVDPASERAWDIATSVATSASSDKAGVAIASAAGVGAIVVTAVQMWKARKRADSADLPYLIVTTSQAESLSFPPGHHRPGVVYVGHPGVVGSYYPVASFHRLVFDTKVAEALELLGSLGATEISIEYLQGFDRGAGVDFSVSPPVSANVKIGGEVKWSDKTRSDAKIAMQLSPTMAAQLPKELFWYWSEPLWQSVAKARLERGLKTFNIHVNYTDDLGINASLEGKIAKVGLELGGKFTDHRETVWKLSGTFAAQSSPGGTSA